jgi:hypothetical protein
MKPGYLKRSREEESKMKKLVVAILILALPALAFGQTGAYSVNVGGDAARSYLVGTAPASLNMSVVLTLSDAGAFGFGGALDGPAGLTIGARQFMTSPTAVNGWGFRDNEDTTLVGSLLTQHIDFGAIDISGSSTLPAGADTVVTLQVNGIDTLAKGTYLFKVIDDPNLPGGADTGWWSNTGSPIAANSSAAFTLTITPEPATMLLLALALPFLRRRSA